MYILRKINMAELKENKFGNIYSNNSLPLPVGRVVFINLATPSQKFKKYGCTLLFKKDDKAALPLLKGLKADFEKLVKHKYGAKAPGLTSAPVGDGDTSPTSASNSNPIGETYKEFKGCYFVRVGSPTPIRVVDANNKDMEASKITAGMLCDGVAQCMLFDKGCSWKGLVIRLVKDDGQRIYTGPDPVAQLTKLSAEFAATPADSLDTASEATEEDNDKKLVDSL